MKVRKFLYSLFLILVASFFVVQPTIAISQRQLEEFANNNIMFYDPGDTDTFDCYSTSASAVTETDNASHIWNWFVNANIPGVSDHAEVIAGILGNFKQEHSALDPFAYGKKADGSPNGFYGLYETNNSNFKKEFEEKFGSDKWGGTYDAAYTYSAIDFQLEFFVDPNKFNWNGFGFLNYLDYPTAQAGEDGAAAYAELAMVLIERPVTKSAPDGYTIDSVHDSGVIEVTKILYGNDTWNYSVGKPGRLVYARDFYNKFANNQILSSAETTVTGNDITIIGDETVTSIEGSLTSTLSGVDIKTADSITAAADLITNDSSIRQNVVLSFDLSKGIIGEDNLLNFLANIGTSKKLYFIIDRTLEDNDNFKNNTVLIASRSDSIKIISVNSESQLIQELSSYFSKPIVNICEESSYSSNGTANEGDYNFIPLVAANGQNDTSNIPCQWQKSEFNGNIVLAMENQSKKLRLCYIDGFKHSDGTPVKTSSEAARAFQMFYIENQEYIKNNGLPVSGFGLVAASSFRTYEQQLDLYNQFKDTDPGRAAAPGSSPHETGYAVDIEYIPSRVSKSSEVRGNYYCKSADNFPLSEAYDRINQKNINDTAHFNRWHTDYVKYLCDTLYKYGIHLTVKSEPWHIQWTGKTNENTKK